MDRPPGAAHVGTRPWTARALEAETGAIVDAYEARVREGVEALRDAARPIVLDHVHDVLRALAAWIEQREVTPDLEVLGASHGIQRVSHGVRLRDLVREQRLLREVVTTAISGSGAVAPAAGRGEDLDHEARRLQEALDLFSAAAVERYAAVRADPRNALIERLRLAVSATGLGAWDYDPLLTTFELDLRARELFGLGDEDRAFGRDEILERVDPTSRPALEAVLAVNDDGARRVPIQARGVAGDAAERWLEVSAWSFRDDGGAPVRVMGTVLDVTEQRQLEQTRDRFLAVLGHDLRSPLNAIAMAAHLLQGHRDPAQSGAITARLTNSVRRMEALIRDLLDFGRAAVGTPLPIAPRAMDIDEVCRKVLDEVRAGHPGATVLYERGADGSGTWDPARLEQVLVNLLHNALKYGRRGAPVTLRWSRDEAGTLLVAIHNEGEPIARELAPVLFEPFRNGPAGPGGAGTGIVLYVVAQILRAHGGDVRVESTAEEGTTFHLRLPGRPA